MAELPHRPPLPPQNSLTAPSPLPTPPSSTTTIPPLCFPSPTSVAHVVNEQQQDTRKKAIRDKIRANAPTKTDSTTTHHDLARSKQLKDDNVSQSSVEQSFSANLHSLEPKQNLDDHGTVSSQEHPPNSHVAAEEGSEIGERVKYDVPLFERSDLTNAVPSEALDDVTKTQFADVLDKFVSYEPPNSDVQAPVLATRIRELLDHLDALVEQPTLRLTNKLFEALSHPKCLAMLLFLLSDISARSTPVMQDVRKSYRYPYLVTNILANGNNEIRESFMDSPDQVAHLLSFLDGSIYLSCPGLSDSRRQLARNNPIIVGNVVQILVSYIETSTEPLLQVFENRPNFVPAVVKLLDTGSVPNLLTSLIPDRCVHDVETMDHCKVSFDLSLTKALTVLSKSTIFHHLSEAFVGAAQTILSVVTNSDEHGTCRMEQHATNITHVGSPLVKFRAMTINSGDIDDIMRRAEQHAYNATQVYGTLVKKTVRAVRINSDMPECRYLNVYSNPETAGTVSKILRAGTSLFRGTNGDHVSLLDLGLSMTIQILKYIEDDRERRVASVSGQPPLLETAALEEELKPVLGALMDILIDVFNTGPKHSTIRLRILELFVECTRVLSEPMMEFIDKRRFSEVALKVMLFHPRNSLMQHVICRGVETALISQFANPTAAKHWLTHAKLAQKVMKRWEEEKGDEKWNAPHEVQTSPILSALVHIACCIQHYNAMQAEQKTEKNNEEAMPTLSESILPKFEAFCAKSLVPIISQETQLCGPKPRRRTQRGSGGLGRTFGILPRSRKSGSGSAHLVKSPSAHRFGYVAPISSLRSRFDEVFVEGEGEEFEAVGCSSLASVFDADVTDALG